MTAEWDQPTLWQQVDDEALADWLGELPYLKHDERPTPDEYREDGRP